MSDVGIKGLLSNNITPILGSAVAGAVIGGTAVKLVSSYKKKRATTSKYKSSRSSKRTRKTKYARTARKRKDTSHRRIRMTKSGQPYIILASGKARFISKKSAKLSRKRKGGRY